MYKKLSLALMLLTLNTAPCKEMQISRSSYIEVLADQARITLAIEAQGQNPDIVEKKLSYVQFKVTETLKNQPLTELTVFGFSLYPSYELETSNISHYNGRVSISFECKVKDAGQIIEKALVEGANRSYGIEVYADEKLVKEGRKQALIKAYNECLDEAMSLLSSLDAYNIDVKKVLVIPEGSAYPMAREMSFMAGRSSGIDYSEQLKKINSQVELLITYDR